MNSRRKFIKILTGVAAGTILPFPVFSSPSAKISDRWGELLPLRKFGYTGKMVTMLGLGGFHVGKQDEKGAERLVEAAIEGGIRYFDTAESYQQGGSEEKLGRYLTPKYRDDIFLMTKTKAVTGKSAQSDLEASLKRLRTDQLDLWLIHSVNSVDDVESRIKEGVLDVFLKAKASGKAKHIGFSGHVTPEAHKRLLELSSDMEACMLPVNLVDPGYHSFIREVVPVLNDKKMAVIAMKSLAGGGFWGGGFEGIARQQTQVMDFITVENAIHFAFSMPVSILISGPDNVNMLNEKI
jgi:predicted aldo/keto reductase-like oxidoreductase